MDFAQTHDFAASDGGVDHGVVDMADLAGHDLSGVDQGPSDMATPPDLYEPPFAAPKLYPTSTGPLFPASADFNGDNKNDLVIADYDSTNSIAAFDFLPGNGDGTFGAKTSVPLLGEPGSIAVGDVNGDNKLDVVVSGYNTNVYVLLGNGMGVFAAPVAIPVNTTTGTITAARLADIDGDGKIDIVASDFGNFNQNGFVWVLLGNGDGTFPIAKQSSFSVSNNTNNVHAKANPN